MDFRHKERHKKGVQELKKLGKKTVIEYRYDSKEEADRHAEEMKRQGWQVEAVGSLFIPNYRSYSIRHKEGAFL